MNDFEFEEILQKPLVRDQLPITYANGNRIEAISIDCGKCSRDLDANNIRGTISFPNQYVVVLDGHGICTDCIAVTQFECRFDDEGSFLTKYGNFWKRTMVAQNDHRFAGYL